MTSRLTILILLTALSATAAEYYVWARSGNTPGDGSNWTNARTNLPSTLTRGDVYRIAGGLYQEYNFNDAASGSTVITIKHATVADHGTDTGWHSTMSTQAVFNASLGFVTSHWVFDGGPRGADWFSGADYGFQIDDTSNVQIEQRDKPNVTNVTVRGVWVKMRNTALSTETDEARRGVYAEAESGYFPNWTFSSNLFSYGNVQLHLRRFPSLTLEYNAFHDNLSNPQNHGETVSAYDPANDDWIVRYNQVRDMIGTASWAVNYGDDWQVYGNVYSDCEFSDGFLGFDGAGNSSGHQIYNETIIRPISHLKQVSANGGSTVVKNCLFMMGGLGTPTFSGSTVSYCGFSGSGTGTSQQTSIATSIFEDYAGGDYRLAENTTAGETLASPFDTDLLGHERGDGQDWSRGAYQFYVESEPSEPAGNTVTAGTLIIRGTP
jgi:hypothetical protein